MQCRFLNLVIEGEFGTMRDSMFCQVVVGKDIAFEEKPEEKPTLCLDLGLPELIIVGINDGAKELAAVC